MKKLWLLVLGMVWLFAFTQQTEVPKPFFDTQAPFEVIGMEKQHHRHAQNDTPECLEWQLTPALVHKLLPAAQPITNSEWHYEFGHYACSYEMELLQNNTTYACSINAGAWFTISTQDSVQTYGSYTDAMNVYFIDGPWKEEDGEE